MIEMNSQNRNRLTDLESELMVAGGRGMGEPGGLPSMGSHRVGHN